MFDLNLELNPEVVIEPNYRMNKQQSRTTEWMGGGLGGTYIEGSVTPNDGLPPSDVNMSVWDFGRKTRDAMNGARTSSAILQRSKLRNGALREDREAYSYFRQIETTRYLTSQASRSIIIFTEITESRYIVSLAERFLPFSSLSLSPPFFYLTYLARKIAIRKFYIVVKHVLLYRMLSEGNCVPDITALQDTLPCNMRAIIIYHTS